MSTHEQAQATPGSRWRNWGGTETADPVSVRQPRSESEVAELISDAREHGLTVKAVGAGHSFSGIAVAPGVQVNLENLRGVRKVDAASGRVTVGAGTHLYEMPDLLAPHGLAMPNLGDIDKQTLAGATSTGTHGTGVGFGGISTQIVGATLVDGTGTVRQVDESDPDLKAVALGLGALGIVTELTLQCVPAFTLTAVENPGQIDEVLESFGDNVAQYDHYEFFWFPHTTCALTKTNTRGPVDKPASGPGKVRRYIDDELLSNSLLGLMCGIGARWPKAVPTFNNIAGRALSPRTVTDVSTTVFASERKVRFRETEYAIPLEAVPDAVREVRSMIERRGYRVSFPIEVRAAAADDLMLSTASGRASGYIAAHRYSGDDATDSQKYFADFEAIMAAHEGRPHWGKMHTRDADYLRSAYPKFEDFLRVRDRLDPNRVFKNPYLDQVLG
ncbi:putative FAD-linked oxidase [Gordonia effusa NBRC 100432]|uniref:Putative FAD-linked oxidase n=1 Tax=Gordonia effusa NBRC 100432 TaxID=1077974 RepID=H0QYD4_9ACTN|nr:D-arabinono-1,4-lactone oxidase [Gordonia effusa]GAB17835.1 putative FAD-linked oxidase [Gordonia effusa NBRC 100432]